MSSLNRCLPGLIGAVTALSLAGCGDTNTATTSANVQSTPVAEKTTPEPQSQKAKKAESFGKMPPQLTTQLPEELTAQGPRNIQRVTDTTAPTTSQPQPTVFYVRTEPETLDLGTVGTNEKPTGIVRLVNTGEKTYKILSCKTNCGCTTTNCPQGKELAPGESTEVEVSVTAGTRTTKIQKYVTFNIEGHSPVRLPVVVNVVSYVTIEPTQVDKTRNPDGRVLIKATDGTPFRIVTADPPVIDEMPEEAQTEHELFVSWDLWDQMGSGYRQLSFELDHPKATKVSAFVRGTVSTVQRERQRLAGAGVVEQPLNVAPGPTDQLAIAIKAGDVAAIEQALEQIPAQSDRDAMLVLAARRGHLGGVKALLDAGANVNATDDSGRTPLISAVQSHNLQAIKLLLERGAQVNLRDQVQGTALSWAAGFFGDAPTLNLLLSSGADVNVADTNGVTPLIWAARFGDVARVEELIESGADVAARDSEGRSALDYASSRRGTLAKDIVVVLEQVLGPKAESGGDADPAG